jgi:hypothetical protein
VTKYRRPDAVRAFADPSRNQTEHERSDGSWKNNPHMQLIIDGNKAIGPSEQNGRDQ